MQYLRTIIVVSIMLLLSFMGKARAEELTPLPKAIHPPVHGLEATTQDKGASLLSISTQHQERL